MKQDPTATLNCAVTDGALQASRRSAAPPVRWAATPCCWRECETCRTKPERSGREKVVKQMLFILEYFYVSFMKMILTFWT